MRYRFSTESLPVDERFAYWRDVICRELYSLTPGDCQDVTSFRGWNEVRDAGRFGFAQCAFTISERCRTAADIARDDAEYVTMYRADNAGQSFDFGSSEITLDIGDMCIVSTSQRFKSRSRDRMAFRTLIVPAAFLAPFLAGGSLSGPLHVRRASPIGALLSPSLDTIWEQIPNISEELGDAVLGNLASLLAVACGANEDGISAARQGASQIRSDLILRHIEHHLADPALTPDHAARYLGMSTRHVHTLLEPTGETFVRYVTRRRLEACRMALENPAFVHRSITDIALGWGFNSIATFYRAFRAAYGIAPGDLRKQPPQEKSTEDDL